MKSATMRSCNTNAKYEAGENKAKIRKRTTNTIRRSHPEVHWSWFEASARTYTLGVGDLRLIRFVGHFEEVFVRVCESVVMRKGEVGDGTRSSRQQGCSVLLLLTHELCSLGNLTTRSEVPPPVGACRHKAFRELLYCSLCSLCSLLVRHLTIIWLPPESHSRPCYGCFYLLLLPTDWGYWTSRLLFFTFTGILHY